MITALVAGLSVGAIYALVAIGYNITLTSSGVLNFAFANILVFGGFIALSATALGMPLYVTLLICAIACALVSGLVERAAIRFMPAGSHAELITTLGAATILTALTTIIWGADPQRLVLFDAPPVEMLGLRVPIVSFILVGLPIVFAVLMHFLLHGTKFGLASRAQSFDREATTVRGVNVRWLSLSAFAVAGAFAGIVGPFVLMSQSATPFLALGIALKGFVALALGGLGSQIGAVLAGFTLGLIEAIVALVIGPYFGGYAVFIVYILVLLFRSQGFFGNRNLRLV